MQLEESEHPLIISLIKGIDSNRTDVMVTLTLYSGSGEAR